MGAEPVSKRGGAHIPVLYHQVLAALEPRSGCFYIDGTVGMGGHAAGILEASAPDGRLLGIDRDPVALAIAEERLAQYASRFQLSHGSFAELGEFVASLGWGLAKGILLDLGLSSMQLQDPDRGFSFQLEGPLDMRFDPNSPLTAASLVNDLEESALAGLIAEYGEEHRARKVAQAIVADRPLRTTLELARVVRQALGGRRGRVDPATRTFQALRIAVNDELQALKVGLERATEVLAPGGRLAVISFHSLEDRLVKNYFRREGQDCICPPDQPVCNCEHTAALQVLTSRPIRPEPAEVRSNPRARSARLRVAERLEKEQ